VRSKEGVARYFVEEVEPAIVNRVGSHGRGCYRFAGLRIIQTSLWFVARFLISAALMIALVISLIVIVLIDLSSVSAHFWRKLNNARLHIKANHLRKLSCSVPGMVNCS